MTAVHTCHHPECKKPVPPRLLACLPHWRQLPRALKDEIWMNYRPGQEVDKHPSSEYLETITKVMAFWQERIRKKAEASQPPLSS